MKKCSRHHPRRRNHCLLLVGTALMHCTNAQSTAKHLFPSTDEYDVSNLFDANDLTGLDAVTSPSFYGAPYGGYGRATRSRLAKLPLRLIGGAQFQDPGQEEDGAEDATKGRGGEHYFHTTDGLGRRYACKVYDEDYLEGTQDSMFDEAIEIERSVEPEGTVESAEQKEEEKTLSSSSSSPTATEPEGTVKYTDQKEEEKSAAASSPTPTTKEEGATDTASSADQEAEDSDDEFEIDHHKPVIYSKTTYSMKATVRFSKEGGIVKKREVFPLQHYDLTSSDLAVVLKLLEGVCAQSHQGYWSYEWCYQSTLKQFHIAAATTGPSSRSAALVYSVESVINLGEYKSQAVEVETKLSRDDASKDELGVHVTQNYGGGDYCAEAKKRRKATVDLRCCTAGERMKLNKLSSRFGNDDDGSDDATGTRKAKAMLVNVQEDKKNVCEYKVTVCSPVLCGKDLEEATTKKKKKKHAEGNVGAGVGASNEKESIRHILSRTLGHMCLQRNEGWWRYEFCHTKRARQFHSDTVIDGTTGKASVIVDGDYTLGSYDAKAIEYHDKEEVDHVQNSRSTDAMYVQEYTHGDVCRDSDVADSATTEGGGIERSTTVRFSCGKNYELARVDEDSSCHYVLTVHVPDLCRHPLFQAPVVKEQVVKCLPVEGMAW